jgi:prepilin-type N-terminal cleavage/methylation domain-containing protein
MFQRKNNLQGFTLIELMIVMTIVSLLMGMVGPLAMNSLEKADAKQEMLSIKNWLRKVSYRAFTTGQTHRIQLSGKRVILYAELDEENPIEDKTLKSLSFKPQWLYYNNKGFVTPEVLEGTYRGKLLSINLNTWVNGEVEQLDLPSIEQPKANNNPNQRIAQYNDL